MYPKISFIIVVRNNEQGLRTTLLNLESISYAHKEIVVIDGGSTDNTVIVAQEFAHIINYFISEPDNGIYDAMNKGIKASRGKFLWFINAGDKVLNFEELYYEFTTDNHLADIYYGDTQIVNQDGEVLGLRRKPLPKTLTPKSFRNGMVVCHQSFIVRHSIAKLYDTSYRFSADYKWMIECVKAAKSIINIECVLSQFEIGGATTQNHKASLKERFSIMRKEFGLVRTLIYHIGFVFDAIFKPKFR